MLSTGERVAAFNTGTIVAIKAIKIDTPKMIRAFINLKFKKDIFITDIVAKLFITEQSIALVIVDNKKQQVVIISAWVINILKTSIPLAPTARKTPISFFLLSIATVIKLYNIKDANKPHTTPAIKNAVSSLLNESAISNDV